MRPAEFVVLGIDAAWTQRNPSGVALITGEQRQLRCLAVAPSYASFLNLLGPTAVGWTSKQPGGECDAGRLLAAAETMAGKPVTCVAVDMPLSKNPIAGRRKADAEVSRAFGAWHCATHSPSSERPGPLGLRLREQFETAGYPLTTSFPNSSAPPHLIEVYPHPALARLVGQEERLRYKAGKMRAYWRADGPERRRERLLAEWRRIVLSLEGRIPGVKRLLPDPTTLRPSRLKSYEDGLDAIVCAWVGAQFLLRAATPYGDEAAAIWVPN